MVIMNEKMGTMQVKKQGTSYSIKSPFSDSKNLILEMGPFGINQIFHLTEIKSLPVGVEGFENATLIHKLPSDWIGPYLASAIKNTVNTSSGIVSGSHGTSSGDGDPTAKSIYTTLKIGGKEVVADGEYLNLEEFTIETKNEVTTTNVIKAPNDEWRAVFYEYVTYRFTPQNMDVIVTIQAKEDMTMKELSGPQITNGIFNTTFFGGDIDWQYYTAKAEASTHTIAEGSKVDRFVSEGTALSVVCYKARNTSINELTLYPENEPIGINTTTKSYLRSFKRTTPQPPYFILATGESYFYHAVYTFMPKLIATSDSLKAYKSKDIYFVDFKSPQSIDLVVDSHDKNKKVVILDASNVTMDPYTSELTTITSRGLGYIKFICVPSVV